MSPRPSAGPAGADPAVTTPHGFDIVPTLSTRPQWFPCGPLPVRHLTWFFPGLFLLCSRPWLLTTAAGGGLEPAPASRFRGAVPHRLDSYALRRSFRSPSRSWRTIIGISDVEVVAFALSSSPGSLGGGKMQVVGFHISIQCMEVYVGRQGAHDAPLWGARQGFLDVSPIHHACTQEFPEQVSDIPVGYSLLHRF